MLRAGFFRLEHMPDCPSVLLVSPMADEECSLPKDRPTFARTARLLMGWEILAAWRRAAFPCLQKQRPVSHPMHLERL